MFVQPTWFDGLLFYALIILIPLVIGIGIGILGLTKNNDKIAAIGILGIAIAVIMLLGGASVVWHYQYEVPSVQETTITISDWQPEFGRYWGNISNAGDLMLQTKDGQLFGNKENFLFGKFDTRDVFNKLKPNGTYVIKYYGWREGFNNGVPNILSVEEVVDESNCPAQHDISNYMNKRNIVYDNGWW